MGLRLLVQFGFAAPQYEVAVSHVEHVRRFGRFNVAGLGATANRTADAADAFARLAAGHIQAVAAQLAAQTARTVLGAVHVWLRACSTTGLLPTAFCEGLRGTDASANAHGSRICRCG